MPLPARLTAVDWTAGCSLLIRQDVLEDVGDFDEGFFLYFEETDLCRRAALAGWRTLYVPQSRVSHVGSASTGMQEWTDVPEYWLDSRLYYYLKTGGTPLALLVTVAALMGAGLHVVQGIVRGRRGTGPLRLATRQLAHFARHWRQDRKRPSRSTGLNSTFRRI